MDDLAAFLKGRLDEDEAAAKATEHNDGPRTLEWKPGGGRHLRFDNGRGEDYQAVFAGEWDRILIARDGVRGGPLATHIASHDPARTLREVVAKRRILGWAGSPALPDHEKRYVLDALAAVYSDHPDYRPEWKP